MKGWNSEFQNGEVIIKDPTTTSIVGVIPASQGLLRMMYEKYLKKEGDCQRATVNVSNVPGYILESM